MGRSLAAAEGANGGTAAAVGPTAHAWKGLAERTVVLPLSWEDHRLEGEDVTGSEEGREESRG